MSDKVVTYLEGDKEYFFHITHFSRAFKEYCKKNGLKATELDKKLASFTYLSEESVKSHRLFTSKKHYHPVLETCKLYGLFFYSDEYAFLCECSSNLNDYFYLDIDIKEIYELLYKVLSFYDSTDCFNLSPTGKDLKDYDLHLKMIDEAEMRTNSIFLFKPEIRTKLLEIIEDVRAFVCRYEIPGIPKHWFDYNKNLKFYHPAFQIKQLEKVLDPVNLARLKKRLNYYPSDLEYIQYLNYFSDLDQQNQDKNLKYSYNKWYQIELLKTLTTLFKESFKEYIDKNKNPASE